MKVLKIIYSELTANTALWFSNRSSREKGILLLCAVLLTAFIAWKIAVEPFLNNWQDVNTQIEREKIDLAKNLKVQPRLNELINEYAPLKKKIEWKIPVRERQTAILSQLEQMTKQAQLDISSMKFIDEKKSGFYLELSAALEVTGNLSNLTELLFKMQKLEHVFDVQRLELKPLDISGTKIQASMLIAVVIYLEENEK